MLRSIRYYENPVLVALLLITYFTTKPCMIVVWLKCCLANNFGMNPIFHCMQILNMHVVIR